jgi:predicted AlkP superfamily phosphohydrolase/phosphomutase
MFRHSRRSGRVIVLGLDGTPYTMIKKLTEEGVMPNLKAIIEEQQFQQMDTSIPEISSVAWSTFMTGKNPGEHGIFGFTDLEPQSYKLRFPTFSDLKAPPLWKELEKSGKRSVVINLPSTYPAKPIQGVLVSGFVALRLEKASYPESIIPILKEMNYRIDVDTMKARESTDFLLEDLKETLEIRYKAAEYFWKKEKWDLFIAVVTGTDRLQHFLMDAFFEVGHEYHQQFLDYYALVDKVMIGGIRAKLQEGMHLMVLSDHGFTKIEREVYLNRWFSENGYLAFKNDSPESIEDIGEESRVFVMDPGRIYINLKKKYPFGEVSEEERTALCEEVSEKLMALQYEGKPVLRNVYKREEIYTGTYAQDGPDLVAQSHYGFDLKGSTKSKAVFGKSFLSGMHTQDDAFLILPASQKIDGKPHISNLYDIIIRMLR